MPARHSLGDGGSLRALRGNPAASAERIYFFSSPFLERYTQHARRRTSTSRRQSKCGKRGIWELAKNQFSTTPTSSIFLIKYHENQSRLLPE
jgi:hypothetical protein